MVIVDGNVHIFDKLDNNNLKQESFSNKLPFMELFYEHLGKYTNI